MRLQLAWLQAQVLVVNRNMHLRINIVTLKCSNEEDELETWNSLNRNQEYN
jgi:hypothetical protein